MEAAPERTGILVLAGNSTAFLEIDGEAPERTRKIENTPPIKLGKQTEAKPWH